MTTKITWCDETWSPITGCTPVSTGCKNCWARKEAYGRLRGRFGYPSDEPFRVTLRPERLDEPRSWRKPRRIFVCSMGDLFHEDVPFEFIHRVLSLAALRPMHKFLLLTKRPQRMLEYIQESESHDGCWILPRIFENIWLGTSVENQQTADERIPYLLRCPAAVRYISYEPALAPVDFQLRRRPTDDDYRGWSEDGPIDFVVRPISWIICGAESIGSRPGRECKLEYIESAAEQAQAAGIPIFVKQIHLDGKLVKDVSKFPKHLRVQEYPK